MAGAGAGFVSLAAALVLLSPFQAVDASASSPRSVFVTHASSGNRAKVLISSDSLAVFLSTLRKRFRIAEGTAVGIEVAGTHHHNKIEHSDGLAAIPSGAYLILRSETTPSAPPLQAPAQPGIPRHVLTNAPQRQQMVNEPESRQHKEPSASYPASTEGAGSAQVAGLPEEDLETFLKPADPRGPVIFHQAVQVLVDGKSIVKQLEMRRHVSPDATAGHFCQENNIAKTECTKLSSALQMYLNRRIDDELRWSKYDGLGFIEMMMW